MDRLEAEFGERIDFIHLNVDDPATADIRAEFGLTRRSQYRLIDADGITIRNWFGPLDESSMVAQIDSLLEP